MSPETAKIYLEACRNEYLSQESQNREFQTKVLGLLTFGMALLAGGFLIGEPSVSSLFEVAVVCGIGVAFIGLVFYSVMVLLPRDWQRPFDVRSVKKHANKDHQPWMVEWMADSYTEAVRKNWPILDCKATCIDRIILFVSLELGFVFLFKVWTVLPIFYG